MKTICCVLKSGGDFDPRHVEWLRRQCAEKMPDWNFRCWSDMEVPGATQLRQGWPKWWAKMNIYAESFEGPALIVDLDTVFLDELKILPEHEDMDIILRDPWRDGFRYPERLCGGFLYLTEQSRAMIWSEWIKDPAGIMDKCCGDDQPFLHGLLANKAARFQDHYVDQVVSYKAHVKRLGLSEDNKIVFFHGIPRPWHAPEPWIPSLPTEAKQPSQELI